MNNKVKASGKNNNNTDNKKIQIPVDVVHYIRRRARQIRAQQGNSADKMIIKEKAKKDRSS